MSDSIKYMVKDVFVLLYDRKAKFDNYHQKQILIQTDTNNYIITSSNNINTDDNLDYLLIENNLILYNSIKNI